MTDSPITAVAQRILKLSALQLLVVPFSSIHVDETYQWRGHDGKTKEDLMQYIKKFSRSNQFETAYKVEQTQIVRAFQAYLQGKSPNFELLQQDAVPSYLHNWDDYCKINVGRYTDDIELMRDRKREGIELLVDSLYDWQHSTSTFDLDVVDELRAASKNYIHAFSALVARMANGDCAALFDSPDMAQVVCALLHCLPEVSPSKDNLRKICAFFQSDHFSEIPYQWLSARVFATHKDMVKRGAFVNHSTANMRLSGFFQDVQFVSIYAPYCDAIVMDKAMATLVNHPRIDLERRYGVKIFSLNNWDSFLAWLDTVESGMSQQHREGLEVAYPQGTY